MEDIQLTKPVVFNFVNYILNSGGEVKNTGFNNFTSEFPSYCNPSIYWDETTGKFIMNQRVVSYYLHATSKDSYDSWGFIHYAIPSDRYDWLETVNYIGVSDNPMDKFTFKQINMKDRKPQWEFHGLEDIRVVRWDGKLYGIGVRRDDNPVGVGRMEMCELDNNYNEVKSVKLKAVDETTYCVKNWMPVVDMPYHFIDVANPLTLVKANPENGNIEVVVKKPHKDVLNGFDMPRGSSHCIPFMDGHLCIVHTCQMYYTGNNRKYARYLHAFIYFNKDWDIEIVSPTFSFNDFYIEFCCGMTMKDDSIYISFALQDNISYILKTDEATIRNFLFNYQNSKIKENSVSIWSEVPDKYEIFNYASDLFNRKDYSGAYTWFQRSVDLFPNTYNEKFMMARTVADLGGRDKEEISLWIVCINEDPERPEAYLAAAAYYWWRKHYQEGAYFAKIAMQKYVVYSKPLFWYNEELFFQLYKDIIFETKDYDSVDKVSKAKKAF